MYMESILERVYGYAIGKGGVRSQVVAILIIRISYCCF